jgi:hypothetical protein
MAMHFLAGCARYWTWCLAGLLLAAAFLPRGSAVFAAAILIVATAGLSAFRAWQTCPSRYAMAQSLDNASGLKDRLSTALHFASEQGEMVACQRQDALSRLDELYPHALITVWRPALFRYPLALAIIFCGLVAYRPAGKPAGIGLWNGARTRQAKSLQTAESATSGQKRPGTPLPVSTRLENLLSGLRPDLAGTISDKGNALSREGQPGHAAGGENTARAGDDSNFQDEKKSGAASNARQADPLGSQTAGRARAQQGSASPELGEAQPSGQPLSWAEKIRQAANALMAALNGNSPAQQNDRDPFPQGAEDAAKAQSQSDSDAAAKSGDRGSQPPGDNLSTGTGDQVSAIRGTGSDGGPPPLVGGLPREQPLGSSGQKLAEPGTTPETVPLQSVPFAGEAKVRAQLEGGHAMVPYRDSMPAGVASTDGTERGSLPLRYRAYVRKYFDGSGQSSRNRSSGEKK